MSVGNYVTSDPLARLVIIAGLPDDALAAATAFYADHFPRLKTVLNGDIACLTLHFAAAPHDHRAWRGAAIAGLARDYAPCRVNALSGGSRSAIAAVATWLGHAPGVTGQLLELAGQDG